MQINYNIDHKLLNLPVFKNQTDHTKRALLISLSIIIHFTKHTGQCMFYQTQLSEDWDITDRYFRKALKILLDSKLIKLVKPYDRKTQTPAIYQGSSGTIPGVSKQYTPGLKAVDARSRVNNINNIIRDDDKSHPNKKEETSSSFETKETWEL